MLVASAQAAPVTVPNFSFENPGSGSATDWTSGNASIGVDPFTSGFTSASDGVQFHYLNLTGFGGVSPQFTESNPTLIGNVVAGTYTLTVAGGRRNNGTATTDGLYIIELLAGGNVIGTQTVVDPFNSYASDSWNDITAVAFIPEGDAAIGTDITIRLTATDGANNQTQGQFDNVRLDYVAIPTPAPTLNEWVLILLALVLIGTGFQYIRRTH